MSVSWLARGRPFGEPKTPDRSAQRSGAHLRIETLRDLHVPLRVDADPVSVAEGLVSMAEGTPSGPERAELLKRLAGLLYMELGDLEQAYETLFEAFANAPADPSLVAAIEGTASAMGRLSEMVSRAQERLQRGGYPAASEPAVILQLARWASELPLAPRSEPFAVASLEEATGSLAPEPKDPWETRRAFLEDWVERAPSVEERVDALLELGWHLAERHPERARKVFDRACRMAPKDERCWVGVEHMARCLGDHATLERCLEQRIVLTPRTEDRAELLMEIAAVRALSLGKPEQALAAYELALRWQPKHAGAAAALFEAYAEHGRLSDAERMAHVLLGFARETENEAWGHHVVSRLGDLADASADPGFVLRVRVLAFTSFHLTADTARSLLEACEGTTDALLPLAAESLAELSGSDFSDDEAAWLRLERLFVRLGDVPGARRCLHRALRLAPNSRTALEREAEACVGAREFALAYEAWFALAKQSHGSRKAEYLRRASEAALSAGEPRRAILALEEADQEEPCETRTLVQLLSLYTGQRMWPRVADVLEQMAHVCVDSGKRVKHLLALAQVLEGELHKPREAARCYGRILQEDPSLLHVFEAQCRCLTRARDDAGLALAYEALLRWLPEATPKSVRHALWHQRGLVLRDRLQDHEGALFCFREALKAVNDAETGRIVIELCLLLGRRDEALMRAKRVAAERYDSGAFRTLYDLLRAGGDSDRAYGVAEALCELSPGSTEEQRWAEGLRSTPLEAFPHALTDVAWGYLEPIDFDASLAQILSVAMRPLEVPKGHPTAILATKARSPLAERARSLFECASEILATPCPAIFVDSSHHGGVMVPTLHELGPAVIVSLPQFETLSDEAAAFLAGRRIAELRTTYRPRVLAGSAARLREVMTLIVHHFTAGETKRIPWSPEEAAFLRGAIRRGASEGGRWNVRTWFQGACRVSSRAGLLLAGSLRGAREALSCDTPRQGDLSHREMMEDLACFSTTDRYAELRSTLRVSLLERPK